MKTKTAFKIFASFFGIGTFIFVGHLLLPETMIWYILGFVFIIIALIVNSIALLSNIIKLIKYDRLETFFSTCILLINIPVAVIYFNFLFNF